MQRLSKTIGELYRKYLPLAEKMQIQLNLDLQGQDFEFELEDINKIQSRAEKALGSALKRSPQGKVTISITDNKLIIKDTGKTLSKNVCKLLSNDQTKLSSRVGFGTTIQINLK